MTRRSIVLVAWALVAAIFATATALAQNLSFPHQIIIELPGDGEHVSSRLTTADFNEDGYTDILVSRPFECRVVLVLGDGFGGFGTPTFLPLGECLFPQAMATADFTGDGHQDLAIGDEDVIVLPGDGAGGFGAPLRSPANLGAVELNMAAADLNHDGHTDLVAPNWYFPGGQFVSVLLGDGTGHLSMRADLQAGDEPVKVALADLNKDRLLDIAAINVNSNDVVVYLAEGPAQFSAGSFFTVGDGPEGLDVADLDADGTLDFAVANVLSDTLSILFGDGTGQFGPSITLPAGPSSTSVAAGDLNGDRLLDLAVANLRPLPEGGVRVLLAERPGIFSGVPLQVASAPEARGLQLWDFDNDLDLDLLLLCGNSVCVFVNALPTGPVPRAERLSPSSGQVGHAVVLRGSNLAGAAIQVLFGRAQVFDFENPGGSSQVILLRVPNKIDPRDPDTVTVTVIVDGTVAVAPAGPLKFTYTIPQPQPSITDFTTGDPSRPRMVFPNQPFVLTLGGENFLTALRVPQRCIALGGEVQESDVLVGSATDTSVSFFFNGLQAAGDYEFLITFSDGSGASILAPHFVDRSTFGAPPVIQSVSLTASHDEAVACDFSRILQTRLCEQGLPGVEPLEPITFQGTYTHGRFEVRVTDPDSTVERDDILLVAASFLDPGSSNETTLVLLDDGSLNVFAVAQRDQSGGQDCIYDPLAGICACQQAIYYSNSNDLVARDAIFTRGLAWVDPSTLLLLHDCILRERRQVPLIVPQGSALSFRIDAVDREGNLSTWPLRHEIETGSDSTSCTGDPCGCCLLLHPADPTACHGLPGLPGPLGSPYEQGACISLL